KSATGYRRVVAAGSVPGRLPVLARFAGAGPAASDSAAPALRRSIKAPGSSPSAHAGNRPPPPIAPSGWPRPRRRGLLPREPLTQAADRLATGLAQGGGYARSRPADLPCHAQAGRGWPGLGTGKAAKTPAW